MATGVEREQVSKQRKEMGTDARKKVGDAGKAATSGGGSQGDSLKNYFMEKRGDALAKSAERRKDPREVNAANPISELMKMHGN